MSRTRTMTSSRFAAACMCACLIGCTPSPDIEYERLLERTASWAASAEMSMRARERGDAPAAYVHDLLDHAVDDLATTADSLEKLPVDAGRRRAAILVCRQLAAVLRAAATGSPPADAAALRTIEQRARAMAAQARGSRSS